MSVLEFFAYLAIALGSFTYFAYYAGNLAEDGFSDESKKRIVSQLKGLKLSDSTRLAFEAFVFASDRFYGRRLFSFRSIWRSILLSLGWIFLVFLSSSMYLPVFSRAMIASSVFLEVALTLLSTGLIIDFASTCLTRWLIRLSLGKGRFFAVVIFFVDIVLSVFLFYFVFSLTKDILLHHHQLMNYSVQEFSDTIRSWLRLWTTTAEATVPGSTGLARGHNLTWNPGDRILTDPTGLSLELTYMFPEGILFYSSILTSLWMWLYLSGYLVHFAALRVDALKSFLLRISNIDEKPFKSIGAAFAFVVFPVILIVGTSGFALSKALTGYLAATSDTVIERKN
jgi:hypothetical protein